MSEPWKLTGDTWDSLGAILKYGGGWVALWPCGQSRRIKRDSAGKLVFYTVGSGSPIGVISNWEIM